MSSVDSLRARFAKEEHDRQLANRAALVGAVHAFPKQNASQSSPKPSIDPSPGASAAATRTWQTNAPHPPRPPIKPLALSTAASLGANRAHQRSQENLLTQQERAPPSRSSSPSYTAASIAAAHQRNQATPASKPARPLVQPRGSGTAHKLEDEQNEDILPGPGTVKDVKRWLQGLDSSHSDRQPSDPYQIRRPSGASATTQGAYHPKPGSTRAKIMHKPSKSQTAEPPPILSPRPLRAVSAASSIEAITQRDQDALLIARSRPSLDRRSSASRNGPPIPRKDQRLRSSSSGQPGASEHRPPLLTRKPTTSFRTPTKSDSFAALARTQSKPAAPPSRRSRPRQSTEPVLSGATQPSRETSNDTSTYSTAIETRELLPATIMPPAQRAEPSPSTSSIAASQALPHKSTATPPPSLPPRPSLDTAASTSTIPSRNAAPSSLYGTKPRSSLDLPATNPGTLPLRRVSPSLDRNALANAIVASSLASSRAPSPTKSPAPSLPPRPPTYSNMQKLALPFQKHNSRTPSPAKPAPRQAGMRQTLREDSSSSSSDDDKRKRKGVKKFVHKHPHKHHEGDRKRWRDVITPDERKRYEGVWAGNRAILLDPGSERVHGFVVREIWRRSRLPDHVLEEVWSLVDEEEKGVLERTEFVVGLWLIDQRLKGRKLPVRVGASVWESGRGGVRVRVPGVK